MFFYYSKATLNLFWVPKHICVLIWLQVSELFFPHLRKQVEVVRSSTGSHGTWHVCLHAVPPGTSVRLVQIAVSFSEDLYIWEEGHFCISACFDGDLCRPGIYGTGWRRGSGGRWALCWLSANVKSSWVTHVPAHAGCHISMLLQSARHVSL